MRRFKALLIMAGLAAAPTSAVAGPSPHDNCPSPSTLEKLDALHRKSQLGLLVMGLTPELRRHLGAAEDRGVLVGRVEPLSPARAAGISVGDVIVSVRGEKVSGGHEVGLALSGLGEDQDVAVELVRSGKPMTVRVPLARDAASSTPRSWSWGISWLRDWSRLIEELSPPPPQRTSWLQQVQTWLQSSRARATQI
jgi:membrane-associated protease RseP (regulator of RpoE activity)